MELARYANVLLKWWWLIVASVIVASVGSYLGVRATPGIYQSRTTLIVGQALQNPNPSESEFYTGQVLPKVTPTWPGASRCSGPRWKH